MATNWIDQDNISFKQTDDNYYNKKVIIDKDGVEKLTKLIENPPFTVTFYTNVFDWITSLIYYPINIPYSQQKPYKLVIGDKDKTSAIRTDINCQDFFTQAQRAFLVGGVDILPKFYNYADFNGYTKIQCWLPYYGFVDLMPNDVMGKHLEFWLSVDYNSGSAAYYICVHDTAGLGVGYGRIISVVTFQLGTLIPLGTSNAADNIRNLALTAVKTAGDIAITAAAIKSGGTGGASTTTSETTKTATSTHRNPSTGRQVKQSTYTIETNESSTRQYDNTKYLKKQLASETFANSLSALEQIHLTPRTDKPNNMNLLTNAPREIKVVIYRPIIKDVDSSYAHLMGKPLGRVLTLGDLTGYTEISYVHTEGEDFATATAEEMELLNNELLGGIIL